MYELYNIIASAERGEPITIKSADAFDIPFYKSNITFGKSCARNIITKNVPEIQSACRSALLLRNLPEIKAYAMRTDIGLFKYLGLTPLPPPLPPRQLEHTSALTLLRGLEITPGFDHARVVTVHTDVLIATFS